MTDYIITCKNEDCGIVFKTDIPAIEYCSKQCQTDRLYKSLQIQRQEENEEKYKDVPDIPTCKICGFKAVSLVIHLSEIHGVSQKKYKREYKAKHTDIYHHSYTDKVKNNGKGIKATCKYCKTDYEKTTPRQDYCSKTCQHEAHKIKKRTRVHVPLGQIKECRQCKKPYKQKMKSPHSYYCSSKCRNAWFYNKKKKKNPIKKYCKQCSKEITSPAFNEFCGQACKTASFRDKLFIKTKKMHEEKYKDIPDIPTCKICGFKAKRLYAHIKTRHQMSTETYRKKYNASDADLIYQKMVKELIEKLKARFQSDMSEHLKTHKSPR